MAILQFNKIYVIESLRETESHSGQELYDDIICRKIEQQGVDVLHELMIVNSKEEFFQALDHIREEVIHDLINPIIHFEIHGSEEGFELNSGELTAWNDLHRRFVELNLLTKNNTFLSLSTCYGGYIHKIISPRMSSPFWGFVGPFTEVNEQHVMAGFQSFFDELLTSFDFSVATQRLNQTNADLPGEFHFRNTEYVFHRAYENYEKKYLTEDVIQKRLESGLAEARNYKEMENLSDDEIRQILRNWMVDKKDILKRKMMDRFFMYDIFPELKAE